MEFFQDNEPDLEKPIIIAAMQDMGNVGAIVIEHINENLRTKKFRTARSSYPTFVLDMGGHIKLPDDKWEYRHTKDMIIFGGGAGQPQATTELHAICQDVIDIAKKYSAKFIYTVGGFHTTREFGKSPKTYVTTTSMSLTKQIEKMDLNTTPQKSIITGFNGLILGYAKLNGIQGIGLYGELGEPSIPQYRSARSVISTLEKLTYHKFGDTRELDSLADELDEKMKSRWSAGYKF